MGDEFCGQWAILPAMVRYDPKLPPNAKLIYAEIAAKINEDGYCFAHNHYFAERFNLKADTVSSLIKRLADAGYIEVDLSPQRGNYDKRRIYLTPKPYDFTGKISEGGIGFKSGTGKISEGGIGFKSGTGKISEGVSDLNPIPLENSNLKLNTPYNPPEGDGTASKKRKRNYKAAAEHMPERFEKFWQAYPQQGRKKRQAAIKAWDKLKPDEAMLNEMAKGLAAQLKSREWQEGFGIPHASTWLNGFRWEDEVTEDAAIMPQSEGRPGGWI